MGIINGYQSDSNSYRKVFEFIQKNGMDPFLDLVNSMNEIKYTSRKNLLEQRIIDGKDVLGAIIKKNKMAIDFLRQFKSGLFSNTTIFDDEFKTFIADTAASIDKVDLYLENVRLLEELKVGIIHYNNLGSYNHTTSIFNDPGTGGKVIEIMDGLRHKIYYRNSRISSIIKPYSDGIIIYKIRDAKVMGEGTKQDPYAFGICEEYTTDIFNANWTMCAENHESGEQYRYVSLRTFGFDASKLPSETELASYEAPKDLNKYRKELVLSQDIPF